MALINPELILNLLTIGFALVIAPIVIIIWRIGLFGGADAFALIVLAVLAPMATFMENPISPFTTLSNASIMFVIPFIINLIRNGIVKIRGEDIFEGFEDTTVRKIIAGAIGYRARNPKFGFSIEKK